jgi:hypothetical protein
MRRGWAVQVLATATLVLVAWAAFADEVGVRKVGLARKDDDLLVSFGYRDIFDDESEAELESGLPTTVLMRMSLVPEKGDEPLSFTLRNSRVIYDLWEEVYHVTVKSPGREAEKTVVEERDEAIEIAAVASRHPLDIEDVPPGTYELRIRVDRNPLSKAIIKGMNNWLKRPIGSSGRLKPGDSFFGSFISFFVNKKLEKAEATKTFRSQPFKL